jgi:hypothetical protein
MTDHYPGLETNEALPIPTVEEERVDQAIFAARQAITDLWNLRLRNETADHLCFEEAAIESMRNQLGALHSDIWHANHKQAAE